MINNINIAQIASMIKSGAYNLANNREKVDALNVFPVPDGDTGTNMSMTFINAARVLENNEFDNPGDAFASVARATLRGARGNSGVILSQIFRGISKEITTDATIDTKLLTLAIRSGSNTAYNAVMKPTEGTILTVIRSLAEAAENCNETDVLRFFEYIVEKGNEALSSTTDMLVQLKNANVVDAGGQGLMYIFEGFLSALQGTEILPEKQETVQRSESAQSTVDAKDIKFTYCTEFIINKSDSKKTAQRLRTSIENKGDCMIVIDEDDIVKVHIHTNHPGYVLEQAVKLGEMVSIKIENMKEQHSDLISSASENKSATVPLAVVAVANGSGMEKLFRDLGVSEIISGGQTMNPSTEDILNAIQKANAENVIVLPNNKNIILAAVQACEIAQCNAVVLETKSLQQGIAAMMSYSPEKDIDKNIKAMQKAYGNIKCGSVTYAVKDTQIDGHDVKAGDFIAISDGHILSSVADVNDSVKDMLKLITDNDTEIITLYYGKDVSDDAAAALAQQLEDIFPDSDIICTSGGQSVYHYLVSVE